MTTLAQTMNESDEGTVRYTRVWVRWADSSRVAVRTARGMSWARNGVDGVTASNRQLVTVEDRDGVLTVTNIDSTSTTNPEPDIIQTGLPYDGDTWHLSEDETPDPTQIDNWLNPATPVHRMQLTDKREEPPPSATELEYGWVWQNGDWVSRSGWTWYGRAVARSWGYLGWVHLRPLTPDPLPVRLYLAAGHEPPAPGVDPLVLDSHVDVTLTYRERGYRFMFPEQWLNALRSTSTPAGGTAFGGIYVGPGASVGRLSRLAVGVEGGMSLHVARPSDLTDDGYANWNPAGELRDY